MKSALLADSDWYPDKLEFLFALQPTRHPLRSGLSQNTAEFIFEKVMVESNILLGRFVKAASEPK